MPGTEKKYKRILLKLSGEALMGDSSFGIDPAILETVGREIHGLHEVGVEIAIVIGGGNIFRGLNSSEYGMGRIPADHMGMLATVINAIALGDNGVVWAAGYFASETDFDPTEGEDRHASQGSFDAFAKTLHITTGDVDGDRRVDLLDFKNLQLCFDRENDECLEPFDFNPDGQIDLADFACFHSLLSGP